jgi:predicted RNA-binding protein with PUA domain
MQNKKYIKKIATGLLIFLVILFLSYKYLYHEHRDISNEKALFSLTANEILKDFLLDESKANLKYLDKSITITGKITNIDTKNNTIVIDEKVFVLLKKIPVVKQSEVIIVQGRVIGYDSLLEEIKLDQAEIK